MHCMWKLVCEQQCRSGFVHSVEQLGDNSIGDCGALNGPFEFRRMNGCCYLIGLSFSHVKMHQLNTKCRT